MKILKKLFNFFGELFPFANLGIEKFNQDTSKIIIASSFKHGQLTEDDE